MINKTSPPRQARRVPRLVETASYLGVFIGILLIGVVCYFELFAPDILQPLPIAPIVSDASQNATEEAPAPDSLQDGLEAALSLASLVPLAPVEEDEPGVHRGEIASGDTASVLLEDWLGATELNAFIEACRKVYPLERLRAGQPYVIYREEGKLARFEYEIDNDRRLLVSREAASWLAKVEEIRYDIQLRHVDGTIDSSLFESMAAVSESPALAVRLAEIFAWEINFIRDIQPGDRFQVLVEKRYRDGAFKGYGKLLAATFVNKGSTFEAYLHKDSFGNAAYFNASGDSLKRAFLKAPLAFNRVSSRFNLRRLHPILRTVRPHPAVDYAAPSGTPVRAIGSGIVTYRGFGKGAGNYISLKHANGYESMYLHLSAFARTLKKGKRVRQGEVIGYVGSTGYSTGPHLDFRMKQNNRFINPQKALSPRDESVPRKTLAAFKADRDRCRLYLEGKKALAEYSTEKEPALP